MTYLSGLPAGAAMLEVYKLDMELARPLLRIQQHIMRGPSPRSPPMAGGSMPRRSISHASQRVSPTSAAKDGSEAATLAPSALWLL
jgi:hypothetical protein